MSSLSSLNADLSIKLSTAEKKLLTHLEDQETLRLRLRAADDACDKAKHSAELSKDQNRKLVELLQKMERKVAEKAVREEQLEEQVITLKESLGMMTSQVERIEEDLERKVRDRDKQVKKWQQKCEMVEREMRMREDIAEIELIK